MIWQQRQIHNLGTVEGDPCGITLSLNARGQVVGGTSDCNYFLHAFVREKGGPMLDLNTLFTSDSGLQVTFALDINDRGEILAKAIPPGVDPHQDPDLYGHLVVLVPCDENHPGIEGYDHGLVDGGIASSKHFAEKPTTTNPS